MYIYTHTHIYIYIYIYIYHQKDLFLLPLFPSIFLSFSLCILFLISVFCEYKRNYNY